MTDDKQKAKKEFQDFLKVEMDTVFDKPLSKEDRDFAVMKEVGNTLADMTVLNNLSSDSIVETSDTLDELDSVSKKVSDLKKQVEIREELDQAA